MIVDIGRQIVQETLSSMLKRVLGYSLALLNQRLIIFKNLGIHLTKVIEKDIVVSYFKL